MVQEAGVMTDPFLVTVLIGLTRLIFTFLAAYLSKKFGRRPTAILSGVGMTLSLITLATHLYLLSPSPTTPFELFTPGNLSDIVNSTEAVVNPTVIVASDSVSYLPISMLLLYILASTIGFLTLPWSMIGEVYPAQVRGVSFITIHNPVTLCVYALQNKLEIFWCINLDFYFCDRKTL